MRLSRGGLINRSRPLTFQFDGKGFSGYAGDTLASALLAAGVKLIGRSFKYHRPRGILTAGSEEPNALVELRAGARREPNTRATVAEVFEGLEARSQNRWPSLAWDVGAVNSLLAPLFVAGFSTVFVLLGATASAFSTYADRSANTVWMSLFTIGRSVLIRRRALVVMPAGNDARVTWPRPDRRSRSASCGKSRSRRVSATPISLRCITRSGPTGRW